MGDVPVTEETENVVEAPLIFTDEAVGFEPITIGAFTVSAALPDVTLPQEEVPATTH